MLCTFTSTGSRRYSRSWSLNILAISSTKWARRLNLSPMSWWFILWVSHTAIFTLFKSSKSVITIIGAGCQWSLLLSIHLHIFIPHSSMLANFLQAWTFDNKVAKESSLNWHQKTCASVSMYYHKLKVKRKCENFWSWLSKLSFNYSCKFELYESSNVQGYKETTQKAEGEINGILQFIPFYSFLNDGQFLHWSRDMNAKFNSISHVWTAVVVSDGLGSKNTVGEYYLCVIIPQKDCC